MNRQSMNAAVKTRGARPAPETRTTARAEPNRGPGRFGRSRICLLALRVCLSGCLVPIAADAAPGAPVYSPARHDVSIGAAERSTVLTGFLSGGPVADLVVLHVTSAGDRLLRTFVLADGAWSQAAEITLQPDVTFVDIARLDGRDRLVAYGGGRLTWLDLESGTEHPLAEVTSDFRESPKSEVLHVDISRDLTGDGRDDLTVPHGHGFLVLVQRAGGTFAEPLLIGPSTGLERVYGADGYRYRPWEEGGRIHEIDYNLDGRADLVFWNDGHFVVHLQHEDGEFRADRVTFTTEVAFDSDQIVSLAAPAGIRSRRRDHMPEGESTGRVLHSLTDMNGDGVADLVVFSLNGSSLWKMHSSYEVHFGAASESGGTEFSAAADSVVEARGIIAGVDRYDFDRDGQVDVMLTSFEPTILKAARVLVMSIFTGAGSFDLEMFRMENGRYRNRPNAVREIRPRTPRKTGERAFWPAVLVGDVNGDERADLLVPGNRKRLDVHLGAPGRDLFTKRPQRIRIALPQDEEYTWLADLDRDGRQDVVMHHPADTGPGRVTLLMSR